LFSADEGSVLSRVSAEGGSPKVIAVGRREFSEAYVQRYPLTRERWKISDGGVKPIWSPSGDELFYESGSKRMAVRIVRNPTLVASRPEVFAQGPYIPVPGRSFDVARDGRLLLIREPNQPKSDEIRVVSNWFAELNAKVQRR
jgi:hypothetical protein